MWWKKSSPTWQWCDRLLQFPRQRGAPKTTPAVYEGVQLSIPPQKCLSCRHRCKIRFCLTKDGTSRRENVKRVDIICAEVKEKLVVSRSSGTHYMQGTCISSELNYKIENTPCRNGFHLVTRIPNIPPLCCRDCTKDERKSHMVFRSPFWI